MSRSDSYEAGFDEQTGKTIDAEACPECDGPLLTEDGEVRCTDCGLIVNEYRLDHAAKRFSFDESEQRRERTGAPLTPARHDRGLSTEIGHRTDGNGNELSARKRRQLSRLRREHTRARWRTKAERNLAHACGEIARMTSALGLPKALREEACAIYRSAQTENLIVGRSIEAIATGSLYAACRCRGDPRRIDELTRVARCNRGKIELGYRVLNAELGLDAQVIGPRSRIPRLAGACDASEAVQHRALELAELADEAGVSNGRNPAGVAAACLYIAGREFGADYTQADLAGLADVTPTTLRARYYELDELVDLGHFETRTADD